MSYVSWERDVFDDDWQKVIALYLEKRKCLQGRASGPILDGIEEAVWRVWT